MTKRKFNEEQIIGILKEWDAGMGVIELSRKHGVSDKTLYNWKSRFGGMDVADARRLKVLEEENRKLKQMLAEQMLDNQALKAVLAKNF